MTDRGQVWPMTTAKMIEEAMRAEAAIEERGLPDGWRVEANGTALDLLWSRPDDLVAILQPREDDDGQIRWMWTNRGAATNGGRGVADSVLDAVDAAIAHAVAIGLIDTPPAFRVHAQSITVTNPEDPKEPTMPTDARLPQGGQVEAQPDFPREAFTAFAEAIAKRRLSAATNAVAAALFGPGDATRDQVEMSQAVARDALAAADDSTTAALLGGTATAVTAEPERTPEDLGVPLMAGAVAAGVPSFTWYGKVKRATLTEASIRYTLTPVCAPGDPAAEAAVLDLPDVQIVAPLGTTLAPGSYVTVDVSLSVAADQEPAPEGGTVLDAFPWLAAVLSGEPLPIGQVIEILEGNGVYASEMTEEAAREALSRVVATRLHQ